MWSVLSLFHSLSFLEEHRRVARDFRGLKTDLWELFFFTYLKKCRHRESNPDTVIHPSTNRAQPRLTSLIETNALSYAKLPNPSSRRNMVLHYSYSKSRVLSLCLDIFMAALCNRAGHYIFALWFLSINLLLFFLA